MSEPDGPGPAGSGPGRDARDGTRGEQPGPDRPAGGLSAPDRHAAAGLEGDWQRLHPLSPLVRAGRGAIAIVFVLLLPLLNHQRGSLGNDLGHLGLLIVVLVVGVISWLVTRWRVEGGVLRVESGLFRRTSERFPLSQIQAIDTVRPGLARVFGLAECGSGWPAAGARRAAWPI